MIIARFSGTIEPFIALGTGSRLFDYEEILRVRKRDAGLNLDFENRIFFFLKQGYFYEDAAKEMLEWANRTGLIIPTVSLEKSEVPLLPLRPGKIVGIARNWAEHAKEGGHSLPDRPIYFVKTNNCAIGPGQPIPIPRDLGRVDHEGELGVVISRRAVKVKAEEALDYILGYTIVNDVTARELQRRYMEKGWPWYLAKSMDGFAPIGPWIVTRSEFEPLEGKHIRVTVNGQTRQDGCLDDMVWKVPQLIAAISAHITLDPGDVICVGTPPGVGPIVGGDVVEVEIEGLGKLSNPVVWRD